MLPCLGLERLVFAFLTQHGMIKTEWPSNVQKAFDDFEANSPRTKISVQKFLNPSQKVVPSTIEINRDEALDTSVHRETLRTLLEECLNLELTEETWLSSRNTFNWDSLNHLKVITSLEKRFDVVISSDMQSMLMDEKSILTFLESQPN